MKNKIVSITNKISKINLYGEIDLIIGEDIALENISKEGEIERFKTISLSEKAKNYFKGEEYILPLDNIFTITSQNEHHIY